MLAVFLALILLPTLAGAADWYVSAAKGSNENDGTQGAPFGELDKAVQKAKSGDTIHLAAGRYYGIGKVAATRTAEAINILGGYDDAFAARDYKKNLAVLTGANVGTPLNSSQPRLDLLANKGDVLVDGLVFEIGERNQYHGGKAVARKFRPQTAANASLDAPTLQIGTKNGKITVQNCLFLNSTHTGIRVKAGQGSQALVRNNWIINTAGLGMDLQTVFHGNPPPPIIVENNTILFTWKYDAYGSRGGAGIEVMSNADVKIRNNVIGFSDRNGLVNTRGAKGVEVTGNIFFRALESDYWGKLPLSAKELGDAAELVAKGNQQKELPFQVNQEWAAVYASRKLIDRNQVEAGVAADSTAANALRGMLGLPAQAGTVKVDAEVHAHPMPLEGAFLVSADAGEAGAK
ncbi:MAG: right-handed parallel beta-helix repeat-containing protein [Myxococcales bacterium]|nr:right-handed parallel beta-helix repeat-containing protein [Myxococcales bacterium]